MGSNCIKVTKYFLFLFNLLFFILGGIILGCGVWILADKTSFIAVLQDSSANLKIGAYIFIGVGAVTMIMGFLGCIGAVNEVRCLLGLYFTVLLLIFFGQVAAGTLTYLYRNSLKEEVADIIGNFIHKYNPNDNKTSSIEEAWDYVQVQAQCCGWNSYLNWTENTYLKAYNKTAFPCSCMKDNRKNMERGICFINSTKPTDQDLWNYIHEESCESKVQEWLEKNLGIILGVCAVIAFIELLGMVLSICLCRHVHTEDYTKVPKY
ncbi:CD82 antigen [Ornithorhynchus anatinus]|uniref:Tetraspanin n=1 Tax=Ornithorhynchus anatinus TaxID=9258 RepID=A0A6I8P193_ORNAN|nr:CD82 antigen [Ornithorhynchus anatinus]XP_028916934.1 CD82 antigen [Ornithorhynchus anatinus]XP_028916935.1 CD82 antigen [Ornithorhynchus anatinus]